MNALQGIEYRQDDTGNDRYLVIDLHRYGGSEALENFLDAVEMEMRCGEPCIPFEEFVQQENQRRGVDV